MKRNDEVQAALIAYLKTKTVITSLLVAEDSSAAEIREDNWQGSDFTYPNIRLRLISNIPEDENCEKSRVTLSWMVFVNYSSSAKADEICGTISNILSRKQFTSNGIKFSFGTTNLIPAVPVGEQKWRSECLMSGLVM